MKENILINETDFNKARKKIREVKDKEITFSSNDDDLNRKILEKENINILLINQLERKDFQKQRNSGFNQVLAKIAKKKNIEIGINLDEIINSNTKEKAEILARIKQNIKLCNKNKLKMRFILIKEKRNLYDLKSLGLILGMPTWMIKDF
jgi:ribonuclease P/MRP protein subunit RPP1